MHVIYSPENVKDVEITKIITEEVEISPETICYHFEVSYALKEEEQSMQVQAEHHTVCNFLQLLREDATLQEVIVPDFPYRPAIEELQEYHNQIAGQFMGKKKLRRVTAEFSRMHSDEQTKAKLSLNYVLHGLLTNSEIRRSVAMKAFFLNYEFSRIDFDHWNLNKPVSGPRVLSSFSAKVDQVIFDEDDLWYKLAITVEGETVHHVYRQYYELEFLHDQLVDESQERGVLPEPYPKEFLQCRNKLVNESKARIIKESLPVPNICVWLRQNSSTRSQFKEFEEKLNGHLAELNAFLSLLTFPLIKSDIEFHFFDVKDKEMAEEETQEGVAADVPQEDCLNISVNFCPESNKFCISTGDASKATYHTYEQLKELHIIISSKWFYKDCKFPNFPSNQAEDIASYLKLLFDDCIIVWDDHLRFALGLSEKEPAEVPPEPSRKKFAPVSPIKEITIDEKLFETPEQVDYWLDSVITTTVSSPRLLHGTIVVTIEVGTSLIQPFTIDRRHGDFEQLHRYLTQSLKYKVEGFCVPKLPNLMDLYELMEELYQISNYYGGLDTSARRQDEQGLEISLQEKIIEAVEGYNQFLATLLDDFILSEDSDVLEFLDLRFEDIYPEKECTKRFEDIHVSNVKRTMAKQMLQEGKKTMEINDFY